MNEPVIEYRRLGPKRNSSDGVVAVSATVSSLWLGPDHLLSVSRAFMAEDYKRFYFRDIQAITLQKTNRAVVWSWIFAGLALASFSFFGFLAYRSDTPIMQRSWLVTAGIFAGIWLVPLLVNLVRGPTCICRLRTAVQTEVLPSLGRIKAAHRALAVLLPLLEQTQGVLSVPEIESRVAQAAPRTPTGNPPLPLRTPALARGPSKGHLHAALYAAVLCDACAGLYNHLRLASQIPVVWSSLLLLVMAALNLTALVTQRTRTVSASLRQFTVVSFGGVLALLFGAFIYGYIAKVLFAFRHPGQQAVVIDFYSLAGFGQVSLAADIIELGFGVTGLVLTAAYLLHRPTPTPTPPAPAPTAPVGDQPTATP